MFRRLKYHNRPTTVRMKGRGTRDFASKREAERYKSLVLLELAGEIRDLKCQVRYPIVVNRLKVCTYVADFVYFDKRRQQVVVEDVKGVRTEVYKLKRKLLFACLGISILET